jgi:hypothetical protein
MRPWLVRPPSFKEVLLFVVVAITCVYKDEDDDLGLFIAEAEAALPLKAGTVTSL